ncbi:MAG: hypothetical protein H7836_14135 [Magnetococcus sp. YQC-3]
MKYNTNKKHFKTFKKYFKNYTIFFGITDWNLNFQHDISLLTQDFACVQPDIDSRNVVISFNPVWENIKPTKKYIKLVAIHECLELFLYRLRCIANSRFDFTQHDLDEEMHKIIRVLENKLLNRI